jgi:hypothetical protein
MDTMPGRLLCIDLQTDPVFGAVMGIEPDAKSIFGARQLLTMARRFGWEIVHARRRIDGAAPPDARAGAMRPLMTERVFFRSGRSISESHGLASLLDSWRGQTVFVASFDHVALLSCLLACYEQGPRLVLVEDVLSLHTLSGRSSIDAFRTAAWHLSAGSTSIAGIIAQSNKRLAPIGIPPGAFPSAPVGANH